MGRHGRKLGEEDGTEVRETMDFSKMPIVKTVVDYKEINTLALHMPGHKRGQSLKDTGIELPWDAMYLYDTTEVDEIDNLHGPEGAILTAQNMAAETFGAEETYFLVNGTTAGILSMIRAVADPGDSIILPRNCHKSVFNGVVLGGLKPVYLMPAQEETFRVAMGIDPRDVEKAFRENPDAKAVVITSPTFYGVCSDLEEIARIAHSFGAALLVDEAHGAHLHFSELCPRAALDCGADAVAQSTHKCLSSLTGTSMLHIRGKRIDREKLRFYLQAYQTTSPNHVMLASLDAARYQISTAEGLAKLRQVAERGQELKARINGLKGLRALDCSMIGIAEIADVDPTRISVSVKELGITGSEAEAFLKAGFNIQLEMSDLYNIVAIFSIGDREESFERLFLGLEALSLHFSKSAGASGLSQRDNGMKTLKLQIKPIICLDPADAIQRKKEVLSLEDSVGRVAGEMLVPYPPGIPVIMPGEGITQEIVEYIKECMAAGIKVNSSAGNQAGMVSVVN